MTIAAGIAGYPAASYRTGRPGDFETDVTARRAACAWRPIGPEGPVRTSGPVAVGGFVRRAENGDLRSPAERDWRRPPGEVGSRVLGKDEVLVQFQRWALRCEGRSERLVGEMEFTRLSEGRFPSSSLGP